MDNAVVQFRQLRLVPAVGSSYQIAGDALQLVDVLASAYRASLQIVGCILISAVHTAVAVVVHRTVADVVFIDKRNDVGNGLRVVGGVAVDFHIEDVATACQVVVRSFHFRLVARAAFIPNGNVVRVRVIVLVGYALDDAERAFVLFRELARQTFGRCGKNTEIVLIAFREFVGTVAHVGNDFQAQLLAFFAFSVVFARKCHQTFCQSDEADAQRALIDDAFYRVVRLKFFRTVPQLRHQERELFS